MFFYFMFSAAKAVQGSWCRSFGGGCSPGNQRFLLSKNDSFCCHGDGGFLQRTSYLAHSQVKVKSHHLWGSRSKLGPMCCDSMCVFLCLCACCPMCIVLSFFFALCFSSKHNTTRLFSLLNIICYLYTCMLVLSCLKHLNFPNMKKKGKSFPLFLL